MSISAQSTAEAEARFEHATNQYLADLYYAEPVMATAMGVHDYDDRLPDLSRHALDSRLRRARAYLHQIDRISLAELGPESRLDYRLARSATQMAIFSMEQFRPFERMPYAYIDTALTGLYLLVAREYADRPVRAAALLARLDGLPEMLAKAQENLGEPPAIYTRVAIEAAGEAESFFSGTLAAFSDEVQPQSLRTALVAASERAVESIKGYRRFLSDVVLPRSHGQFAVGREAFDYMLRVGHMLEETADDLTEIGRSTLDETRAEMARVAREIEPGGEWPRIVAELKADHPSAGALVETYAAEMRRARDFVADRALVSIPANESLRVVETPPFARAMLPYAAYFSPAPFEERQDGLFWVTTVDPTTPPDRQEAQLQGHSVHNISIIALHEGYPGHHLQFSRANRVASRFRRHFGDSNLFCEGWALYCEEMMYQEGFYSDPRARLMQLKNQLWRACRVIVDVALHTGEMSFDEAVRFMVDKARLEEPNAIGEVRRYVANPTQPMSYVMGKRLIQKLRDDVVRRRGARFDLRAFHDELLSFGTIPPRLVRDAMLAVP